jgi:hypothetical protein
MEASGREDPLATFPADRSRHAPARVRVDADRVEPFVARTPDPDGLVRLGFNQVRIKAATYPVLGVRLLELLHKIDQSADGGCDECVRHAPLVERTVATAGLIEEDVALVAGARRRLFDDRRSAGRARHAEGCRGAAPPSRGATARLSRSPGVAASRRSLRPLGRDSRIGCKNSGSATQGTNNREGRS